MSSIDVEELLRRDARRLQPAMPSVVAQRLEETLSLLPDRNTMRRSRLMRRFSLTAASVAIAAGLFAGAVALFPDAVKELQSKPGTGSMVEMADDQKTYSVTEQGITVTVDKVQDDGFIVQADMSVDLPPGSEDKPEIGYVLKLGDIWVTKSGRTYAQRMSKGHYRVMFTNDTFAYRPLKYDMHIYVTQIGKLRGKWFLTIPVKQDTSTTINLSPNISKTHEGMRTTLNKLSFSPLSTRADFNIESDKINARDLGYIMIDDKGNAELSFGFFYHYEQPSNYWTHRFMPISKTTRSVRFLPFTVDSSFYNKVREPVRKPLEHPPTAENPIVLPQGGTERILVTGIEFLQDKTLVKVKTEGTNPYLSLLNLVLMDESRQAHSTSVSVQFKWGQKDYTLEYPAMSPKIEFTAFSVPPVTYYPELEISVDLPK